MALAWKKLILWRNSSPGTISMRCAPCAGCSILKTAATRINYSPDRNVAVISLHVNKLRREKLSFLQTRMNLAPANVSELSRLLGDAHARGEKITSIDLRTLGRLLEHKAEDMTATVEAGITLSDFQQQLARHGQWLPIDPPNPTELTIGAILEKNASGPRRFGYGTIRDY